MTGRSLTERKTEIVQELITGGFRLDLLLETPGLTRSTYYYHLKQLEKPDKDHRA